MVRGTSDGSGNLFNIMWTCSNGITTETRKLGCQGFKISQTFNQLFRKIRNSQFSRLHKSRILDGLKSEKVFDALIVDGEGSYYYGYLNAMGDFSGAYKLQKGGKLVTRFSKEKMNTSLFPQSVRAR